MFLTANQNQDKQRKNLLARVHILKKGVPDENYRCLLQEYFECDSSAKLDVDQLRQFITTLEFAAGEKQWTGQDKMIFGLWQELFEQEKTGSGSVESLNKWIFRQTKVKRLEWLDSQQKSKVIEALKKWKARRFNCE